MRPARVLLPLTAAASLIAAACAGAVIPAASPELATAANARGGDPATLAEGRALYVRKCSGCHPLRAPARHGEREWRAVLDEMSHQARLAGDERAKIENYLLAAAALPKPPGRPAGRPSPPAPPPGR